MRASASEGGSKVGESSKGKTRKRTLSASEGRASKPLMTPPKSKKDLNMGSMLPRAGSLRGMALDLVRDEMEGRSDAEGDIAIYDV